MPAEYEVLAVRTGTLASTRSQTYYRYGAYGEPDGPLQMDYFFWVIRNDTETILLDTGFHKDAAAKRGRTFLSDPLDALPRLGIDPDEVSRVIISHFHYDHIGNVAAFPRARISLQQRELDFWTGPYAARPAVGAATEVSEIDYLAQAARDGRVDAIDGDAEIAPGVDALLIAGHCPGQQVIVVATQSGPVALVSDAVHLYEEIERDMPFDVFTDIEGMYRAYETLRKMHERDGTVLIAGHDPLVMENFTPLEGARAELGVRIG